MTETSRTDLDRNGDDSSTTLMSRLRAWLSPGSADTGSVRDVIEELIEGNETGKRHPNILEGASIFASSTILGNIEIGENSIIAAGSLVLNDVQENTTVAGIPARKVKYLIKNQSDWDPGDSSL